MKTLLFTSIAITIGLIACTFDDFLSLHDVKADYVSRSALSYLHIETSEALPKWTDTTLEWTSLKVSYAVRSVLVLSNLAILFLLTKLLRATKLASVEA